MSGINEKLKDLSLAATLLAIGIGGFLFINPQGAEVTEGPGGMTWRSMPFIYSGLILLLAAIWLIRGVVEYLRGDAAEEPSAKAAKAPASPATTARRVITVISVIRLRSAAHADACR